MSRSCLESDVWSDGESQVVVRSIVEIHLIANISADADRTSEELNSSAWIENAIHIGVLKC